MSPPQGLVYILGPLASGDKPVKPGAAENEYRFDWSINALAVEAPEGGPALFTLRGFSLEVQENGSTMSRNVAYLTTDVSLRDGEKVVVGTTAFKDKGLIVVLTARLVK